MALIIDSTVFVDLERRGLRVGELWALVEENEEVWISVISLAELMTGEYMASTEAQETTTRNFVQEVQDLLRVINIDSMVARVYANLWATLRRQGSLLGAHDMWIGATALAHGYAVLTDNVRDFERIPGLEVRRPAWP